MNVHGYELSKDWSVSSIGSTAQGSRGGKRFFLKKYGGYKMPRHDASTNARSYERLKAQFDEFTAYRIEINTALSSLAGPGGNIILPTDWFVDDIYYIEATEFVANLIEDEALLHLPKDKLLFVMLTAAGALHNIHRKNIVHSDLKRTNILAAENSAGKTVAKIIDFDMSYFADRIRPDDLGGDQSFMSPELSQCFIYDMADEVLVYLSTKSDIFSLGLVFYNYLTGGKFPQIRGLTGALKTRADSGKAVYCGEAILSGAELVIGREITDSYLSHLLAAMLQLQPEDRPSAQEVMEILKTKRVVDISADSKVKIEGEPAGGSAPRRTATPTPAPTPTPTPAPAPEVRVPDGYAAPWDGHSVKFKEDKLAAGGYIASEQFMKSGVKCYRLYKRDKTSRVFNIDTLIVLGFAEKTGAAAAARPASTAAARPAPTAPAAEVSDDGTLWETDSEFAFDMAAVTSAGYKSVAKATKNGIKGYVLIKMNDDQRFMTFDKLKLLRYVVKKS